MNAVIIIFSGAAGIYLLARRRNTFTMVVGLTLLIVCAALVFDDWLLSEGGAL
jgi:hypothetical protein